MKKNILFSTTRQWNPGDEFILLGIINLLEEVIGEFNPIIYNRNPEVRQYFNINPFRHSKFCDISFRGKRKLESFFRIGFWDNSFKNEMNLDFIDYVIFAGSPEWMEGILDPLYEKLQDYNKPILYLGIGSGRKINWDKLKEIYKKVIKKAKLITVRDYYTYNLLQEVKPYYLPCPAIFSSKKEKKIKKIEKVGLIFSTYKAVPYNRISGDTYKFIIKLYSKLIQKYDCEFVCHYIDELPEIYSAFDSPIAHYSYDSKDYIDIYNKFDLVIGPRVHGIGLSASQGIPGILISHDQRGDTGKGFLANIVDINTNIKDIDKVITTISSDIEKINSNLLEYKKIYKNKYISFLKSVL